MSTEPIETPDVDQTVHGGIAARVLYKPIGIVASIAGGFIAGRVFRQIYGTVTRGQRSKAPKVLDAESSTKEVVLAAVLEAAVMAGVKTLIDRASAQAFRRWSGEWPAK